MHSQPANPTFARRDGFTLIELLVVISIIGLLTSVIVVAFARSGENARVASTKTLLRQLDSALKERVEHFRRNSFRSEVGRFQATQMLYGYGFDTVQTVYKELRFRGVFPQRAEDMWGIDDLQGSMTTDADNAPIWRRIKSKYLNVTGSPYTMASELITALGPSPPNGEPLDATGSSELLYLFLTEGESFGAPPLNIESVNPGNIGDSDADGLLEFLDGWGRPVRFYNCPTGLLRPAGNDSGSDIELVDFQQASLLITALNDAAMWPLPATVYDHPLNIDPLDPLGELNATIATTTTQRQAFETNYHAMDTFWSPLIVSAGPDERFGLQRPDATGINRLCVVDTANVADLYDNLTNLQRGGF